MTDKTDIRNRLSQSVSQNSLRAEQRIVSIIRNCGWHAEQSVYYTDSKTEKVREIDVLCQQLWKKKLKAGDLIARLFLLIEAKSTADYHLIFSNSQPQEELQSSNSYWIGYDYKGQDAIVKLMLEAGVSEEDISRTIKQLLDIGFPQGYMRTAQLRIPPLTAPMYASAFRETNIGNEKELDNSVLWRALTALHSAVESIKSSRLNDILGDINRSVKYAPVLGYDSVDEVLDDYERAAQFIDLFHPIVVTESNMWSSTLVDLEEINWCRFVQVRPYGSSYWWADVVRANYFEAYVQNLIKYYEMSFKKSRSNKY
jgi:hypothetical protein